MRQMISGLVAAVAVMTASAVPAMACGGGLFQSSCSPCGQAYVSPCEQSYVAAPIYTGCNTGCGGWAHERLPDPEQQYYGYTNTQQYYYVNQGPTYSGPGNFAPYPTYQENGWDTYRRRSSYYGYDGGGYTGATSRYDDGAEGYSYRARPHFRPWRARTGYEYSVRPSVRYGYAPRRSYTSRYSLPPQQYYGPRRSMRYGAPRHYGQRERTLRRYY
jgi:hypothetical protein